MARIRSLKPSFFTSEQVVSVSIPARYLFQGMWVFGDDEGYISASNLQLKMQVFPGDAVDVAPLVDELIGVGLVERLETDQGSALKVPSFRNHQSPKYPTPSKFTVQGVPLTELSPRVPPGVPKDSPLPHPGEERRGEEREEREDVAAKPRPDVIELCTLLADLIEGNGSKRPTIGQTWLDAARLMIDKDKRDVTKAANLIRWSQESTFWQSTILSMPKFREQYDKLRLQALRDHEEKKPRRDPDAWMNP